MSTRWARMLKGLIPWSTEAVIWLSTWGEAHTERGKEEFGHCTNGAIAQYRKHPVELLMKERVDEQFAIALVHLAVDADEAAVVVDIAVVAFCRQRSNATFSFRPSSVSVAALALEERVRTDPSPDFLLLFIGPHQHASDFKGGGRRWAIIWRCGETTTRIVAVKMPSQMQLCYLGIVVVSVARKCIENDLILIV